MIFAHQTMRAMIYLRSLVAAGHMREEEPCHATRPAPRPDAGRAAGRRRERPARTADRTGPADRPADHHQPRLHRAGTRAWRMPRQAIRLLAGPPGRWPAPVGRDER